MSWLARIIPIHNGEPGRRWRRWTRVRHLAGGRIIKQERSEPSQGWTKHWRQYRAEHPELEKYWVLG